MDDVKVKAPEKAMKRLFGKLKRPFSKSKIEVSSATFLGKGLGLRHIFYLFRAEFNQRESIFVRGVCMSLLALVGWYGYIEINLKTGRCFLSGDEVGTFRRKLRRLFESLSAALWTCVERLVCLAQQAPEVDVTVPDTRAQVEIPEVSGTGDVNMPSASGAASMPSVSGAGLNLSGDASLSSGSADLIAPSGTGHISVPSASGDVSSGDISMPGDVSTSVSGDMPGR